ncbi:hypothetical protein [Aeromonas cavernicola]|uniref:hypothetical protein n=1 Tax=Aeromonas cavernicola TaxID=1006623 RepID=UPI0012FD2464|nr:hypothetical protein [Aeromonas cavernicola]
MRFIDPEQGLGRVAQFTTSHGITQQELPINQRGLLAALSDNIRDIKTANPADRWVCCCRVQQPDGLLGVN